MRRICWPTPIVLMIALFASICGSTKAQQTGVEGASADAAAAQRAQLVQEITREVIKALEARAAPAEPPAPTADLRKEVSDLGMAVDALRRDIVKARDDLDKNVEKLERVTQQTPDGGIILRQQTTLPVGKVIIRNRTPYPQRMWVNNQELLLPGYGNSEPVDVFPGAIVTQLESSGEGPRNWHVGPGSNHTLVLYINP